MCCLCVACVALFFLLPFPSTNFVQKGSGGPGGPSSGLLLVLLVRLPVCFLFGGVLCVCSLSVQLSSNVSYESGSVEFCFVFCVLCFVCFVFCVLCFVFCVFCVLCVLCFVFCVLCFVFCVLRCCTIW